MDNGLKLSEVAHRLGISERTARRYVRSGELPSVYYGAAYRVSEEALEAFVESRRSKSPKAQAPSTSGLPEIEASAPGGGVLEKLVGGSYIQQMNYHAAVCEGVLERGDQNLDWLGDVRSMASEFWLSYRHLTRRSVREQCTRQQLEALDAAEKRMRDADRDIQAAFTARFEEKRNASSPSEVAELDRWREERAEREAGWRAVGLGAAG